MSTRPALSKREAKKDANINQKKANRVLPRELFKFKYLRFKCRDAARTIDFYKSCGMNLDFDGDLVSFKNEKPNSQQKVVGKPPVATMESNHMKKIKEEAAQQEEKGTSDLGGPLGRVFGLSYPPTGGGAAALLNRIQLVFEEDKEFLIDSKFNAEKEKNDPVSTESTDQQAPKKPEKKNLRQYEYLVIYVHFITRLVKRMVSKGFEMTLDITQFDNNIKMAILRDPNEIEIRLIEMPDNYMNDSSHQKQWFARLGYYTIPTSLADKTVMLYESLFQIRTAKAPPNNQKVKDAAMSQNGKDEPPTSINIRKIGPNQMVKNAMTKGAGFRIVDMDEMVVGLMDSVFYWMGNDMRTSNCCVCFTEVSNADTGEAITYYEKNFSPLIAIGFEVPNLDAVVAKLKNETKDALCWDSFRYRMSKSGIYARFNDTINGICLDLLCTKLDPVIAVGKTGKDRQQNNKFINVRKEVETKEEIGYSINLNHLKGHARVFSEGAINFGKGYGWELRKDAQVEIREEQQEKATRKEKKMLSMFRDEIAANGEKDHMGSHEDLHPGVPKRQVKQVLGRVRDAEIAIIENLLNREKSKSF